jgi:branched-chain amino acid transport system ATP-binding protein
MLEIDDLVVKYDSVTAVRGISLRVDEGELVALVGPNGAGKSTTLGAVAGLRAAAGGSVRYRGRSLRGLGPESVVRCGIALVPEGRNIFGSLTVAENLALGATIRKDRAAVAADLAGQVERFPILGKRLHAKAGLLSGGEQQQLAIARALMSRPTLLMLDEPSLGLAPRVVDAVFEAIAGLHDEGVSILLVEQNASRAVAMSDRAYVLRTGQVVRSGTSAELGEGAGMAEEYLGVETAGDGS